MNILCSYSNEQIAHEDCLKCALKGNAACGYDYSILRVMFNDKSTEARRGEIHVTDLTGCLRRAWYSKSVPTSEYPHETLARQIGKMMHTHVEGTDENLQSELPIAYDGLVGTADLVYADGRLADVKTTRWIYRDKLPYGSHALQVNIYAHMLRKMGREINRLQICYVDMSGPTKCRSCKVPVRMFNGELKCPKCFQYVKGAHLGVVTVDVDLMPEQEIENLIQERKSKLMSAVEMGLPPEKEPGFLCAYCSSYNECLPEEANE